MVQNKQIISKIYTFLEQKLPIKIGVNKKNELARLIYEISQAKKVSLKEIAEAVDVDTIIKDGKSNLFHKIKKGLIAIRYPSFEHGDNLHLMPLKIRDENIECKPWDFNLKPESIFVEKSVKDMIWTCEFIKKFPSAKVVVINSFAEGARNFSRMTPVEIYNPRRENIFLIKNKSAFIKICPCTKGCVRCGYWILNVGFGCPIDCTYCYLQMYSNSPGIILPANIEEYFNYIVEFDKKVGKRTRIGTGEFTDSLALDKYTNYSSYLISFFRETKNLVLELKTKVADINNVLKQKPHRNVVLSWSMNPDHIAEKYEQGSSKIEARINAALLAVKKGYKIAFHFDPLVYYDGWENDYRNVVEEMFLHEEIIKHTVWVSLGSLRYTPGLKQAAEQRFSENNMFYRGEFFVDELGKFRYPKELRIDMYNKMTNWIRSFKTHAWIYLCMEPEDVWAGTLLNKEDGFK
ncbi:MAG: spore photoproduct lyase family protein [Candidatus Omnitrophota bacterium]|nr:hypothetical protein [Candidatus Omnitrophota bacterium]